MATILAFVPRPETAKVTGDGPVQVYLSRRNLLTLLNKLDANKDEPNVSKCTLIKSDNLHPKYPQSHPMIAVTAVEDEDYYTDRRPGPTRVFPVQGQGRPH